MTRPLGMLKRTCSLTTFARFHWKRLVCFPFTFKAAYRAIDSRLSNLTDDLQLVVSIVWFIYDFSVFAFGTYSSIWLDTILGGHAPLWKTFGWNVVTNLFYLPGSFAGAFVSDWIGPRMCLIVGMTAQAVVGFIMSGCYEYLSLPKNVAGFVVVYG